MITCPYLIYILFVLLGHLVKQRLCKSYHETKILLAQQGNGKEIEQSVNKTEINNKTYRSLRMPETSLWMCALDEVALNIHLVHTLRATTSRQRWTKELPRVDATTAWHSVSGTGPTTGWLWGSSQNRSPGLCPQQLPLGEHRVKYLRDLPFTCVYVCGETCYFTNSSLEEQYPLPPLKKRR